MANADAEMWGLLTAISDMLNTLLASGLLQCAQLFMYRLLVTCQMPSAVKKGKTLGFKKEKSFTYYLRHIRLSFKAEAFGLGTIVSL